MASRKSNNTKRRGASTGASSRATTTSQDPTRDTEEQPILQSPPKADDIPIDVDDNTSDDRLRPSSTMTREVAVPAQFLPPPEPKEAAPPSSPPNVVPPAAPTTRYLDDREDRPPTAWPTSRALDDLAQTIEAPAAPRILLLDAAESVIAELGYADSTASEIARVAGVSVDVFHAHFSNMRSLLSALNDRFCAQAIALTDDATRTGIWERATPRDVIQIAVRSILDVVMGRSALVKAVLASGDDKLLNGFRAVGSNMTARVLRVLDETSVQPHERPAPEDVAFSFLLAVSIAHHTIMIGTEWSGMEFEREDLYERVTQAVTAYLDSKKPARS